MDLLPHQIAQCMVHRPLPGDPVLAGEGIGDDLHGEVAFARPVMPGMAAMLVAVVDDGEMRRAERFRQAAGDFCGDGACGYVGHLAYIG